MEMKTPLADYLYSLINSVEYHNDNFTAYDETGRVVEAVICTDSYLQKFFDYSTLYRTVLDLDKKIKRSFWDAITFADDPDIRSWKPFDTPSASEQEAIYFTENAIFRIESLWDLLAQIYCIDKNVKKASNQIHSQQIFHDYAQGRRADPFAKDVYSYFSQTDDDTLDDVMWQGNHRFVKDYRNKMTHRNSPNITTTSSYDIELRMPMSYVLKRSVEDYRVASLFLQKLTESIGDKFIAYWRTHSE